MKSHVLVISSKKKEAKKANIGAPAGRPQQFQSPQEEDKSPPLLPRMHDNEETVRTIPRILSNSSDEVPGAKVEILERIEEYTKNINRRLRHHHSRQREMRQVGEESQRAVMDALLESQHQQLQMEQKITQIEQKTTQIEEKMQYQQLKNEEKIAQISQKLDQFKSEQARDLKTATFKIINAISDLSKKIDPNDSFSESDDLHLPPFQAQTSRIMRTPQKEKEKKYPETSPLKK